MKIPEATGVDHTTDLPSTSTLTRKKADLPAASTPFSFPFPLPFSPRVFSTPAPAVKRVRRESMPLFSPAVVCSPQDRRVFSHSRDGRSVRRSVVMIADAPAPLTPLRQLLAIATPGRIIETAHILGEEHRELRKIGEGSYADVYSATRGGEEVVMKIVPVDGRYNDQSVQTSYEDILSESLISVELTRLLADAEQKYYAPVFAKTHFIKVLLLKYGLCQ